MTTTNIRTALETVRELIGTEPNNADGKEFIHTNLHPATIQELIQSMKDNLYGDEGVDTLSHTTATNFVAMIDTMLELLPANEERIEYRKPIYGY
jgi:hypothetical protein